jgi:WD40 repeat protein
MKVGKEYLQCKRARSEHIRDVNCLDITTDNHMVTGSIDNVICFWQTFDGKIQKSLTIPTELADCNKSYIVNLKFAEPDSNEFLLCMMSTGHIFCLETLTENFLKTDKNEFTIA